FLVLGYFRYAAVFLATRKLITGDQERAQKLINQTYNPDWLAKGHQCYYYFVQGFLACRAKRLDEGSQHFEKAIEIGLRTDNDTAIAYFQLATIALEQENIGTCQSYLDKLDSLKYKPALDVEIDKVKTQLENLKRL
ncbi:MAG: hypothetical protein MK212_22470, partial [Saprospiraceae bacterium]|nr:hypothetical protein [Saprospiraceae bacterium]